MCGVSAPASCVALWLVRPCSHAQPSTNRSLECDASILSAGYLACVLSNYECRSHPSPPSCQGPELEREALQIGIVTAIAAPAALRVRFSGAPAAAMQAVAAAGALVAWWKQATRRKSSFHIQGCIPACCAHAAGDGGHAGAQLMPLRNDASLAAAELALFVEKAALGTGWLQLSELCWERMLAGWLGLSRWKKQAGRRSGTQSCCRCCHLWVLLQLWLPRVLSMPIILRPCCQAAAVVATLACCACRQSGHGSDGGLLADTAQRRQLR